MSPVFGGFGGRGDLDAIGYWTVQNLGVGNVALIKTASARLKATRFQEIEMLNLVRAEVAEAYARSHARFAQLGTLEVAVNSGVKGFRQDYARIQERDIKSTLPIELLDNFRLLNRARREYLDSIVDYNRAQFELFVAMGQPPADALAHQVPVDGYAPSGIPGPNTPKASLTPAAGFRQTAWQLEINPDEEPWMRGFVRTCDRWRWTRKAVALSLTLLAASATGCLAHRPGDFWQAQRADPFEVAGNYAADQSRYGDKSIRACIPTRYGCHYGSSRRQAAEDGFGSRFIDAGKLGGRVGSRGGYAFAHPGCGSAVPDRPGRGASTCGRGKPDDCDRTNRNFGRRWPSSWRRVPFCCRR